WRPEQARPGCPYTSCSRRRTTSQIDRASWSGRLQPESLPCCQQRAYSEALHHAPRFEPETLPAAVQWERTQRPLPAASRGTSLHSEATLLCRSFFFDVANAIFQIGQALVYETDPRFEIGRASCRESGET